MRFMTYAVAAGLVAVVAPAPAQAMLTDRESIAEVQILLRHLGYEPGVIDGLQGPLLSSAIRAFETDLNAAAVRPTVPQAEPLKLVVPPEPSLLSAKAAVFEPGPFGEPVRPRAPRSVS